MLIAPIRIPEPVYHHPIELELIARLTKKGDQLVEKYLADNWRDGIPFIARDAAKLIFPEFLADRTRHNRYTDAVASAVADAARRTLLLRPAVSNQRRVSILTGCPASGKTGGSGPSTLGGVEFVHETILSSITRASELIEQALSAERSPSIRLFYLDDPRKNVQRMIARARVIGRTVPLRYMAETYVNLPSIVNSLQLLYGQRVEFRAVNNSGNPSQAVHYEEIQRAFDDVDRYTEKSALEAMHAELDKISSSIEGVPEAILAEAKS